MRHCSNDKKRKSRLDGDYRRSFDPEPECGKQNALGSKVKTAKTLPKQVERYSVTIERYSPRTLDDDNFYGGCKQLRDAISTCLEKSGDSPKDGIVFNYVQVKSKTKKTVIKINKEV